MKSNLKSFLPIFLILGTFSYVFSSNNNEENSHLISKEPSYSNDLSKSVFSFSQNEYFISSNAIIEQGRDIVYGEIDGSVFYSGNNPSNFTFSFSNDSICSLVESTYNEEEHTIFFTLKGLKKGYTALQIEDSAKIVKLTTQGYIKGKNSYTDLVINENGHQEVLSQYMTTLHRHFYSYLELIQDMGCDVLTGEDL